MPTIFTFFGFRFMVYTSDHEPVHVHVKKDGHEAKFTIKPVTLVENSGFKRHELSMIASLVEENEAIIEERWKEIFKEQ